MFIKFDKKKTTLQLYAHIFVALAKRQRTSNEYKHSKTF